MKNMFDEEMTSFSGFIRCTLEKDDGNARNANKLVYKDNLKMFKDWKKGKKQTVEFGDYVSFLDSSKLYKEKFSVDDMGTVYEKTEIGCINADCVDVAEKLIEKGFTPAMLNLASCRKPGGGYETGASAQEESLCRMSDLSLSIYQFGNEEDWNIVDSGVPHKEKGYPFDINYGGIYSEDVLFFRNNLGKYYSLREKPFRCGVITVGALSFSYNQNRYAGHGDRKYMDEATGSFTKEGREIMLNKIRTILRMGVEHQKDSLVLGAFGCGAYHLPPKDVSDMFKEIIEESEFKNKFKVIVFAILEKTGDETMEKGKFADFYRNFGYYTV